MSKDVQEEVQEELSFEDAFNELVDGDDIPDDPIMEDPQEEPQEETLSGDEPEIEQPRDERGRFATQDDPAPDNELNLVRQELDQWKHRYNSDLGRQSALQRKIQEQQQLIESLQSKASQAAPEGVSPSQWDSLMEDFPEIAQAMDARLSQMSSAYEQKIAQLQTQLQPIHQQTQQAYRDNQYRALAEQHPDWQSVAQSNEFNQWLQTQPAPVRALYDSEEAADAAYLIGTYKAHSGMQTFAATDELKQRRQRQLHQSQTISNRGGRPKSSLPPDDDFEAAFNYYADRG